MHYFELTLTWTIHWVLLYVQHPVLAPNVISTIVKNLSTHLFAWFVLLSELHVLSYPMIQCFFNLTWTYYCNHSAVFETKKQVCRYMYSCGDLSSAIDDCYIFRRKLKISEHMTHSTIVQGSYKTAWISAWWNWWLWYKYLVQTPCQIDWHCVSGCVNIGYAQCAYALDMSWYRPLTNLPIFN